ncbi:MAG: peptidylprolyl isomerase [Candidatus Aminicenantales bacterium]
MSKSLCVAAALLGIVAGLAFAGSAEKAHPRVVIKTTKGDITLELFQDKAPLTVKNFLAYVEDGFYDGTIFHRVIKGFMIQGGGLTPDLREKPARAPIKNEADNGLKNKRGTIAMARTSEPHSATCQFFINHVHNDFLNFSSPTPDGYGYCVFGKVVSGMDVVDAIASVPTMTKRGMQDVPRETIQILSIRRID